MYLHGTSKINANGHLEIGGCDVADLAAQFGTPLYIVDEALVRQRASEYVEAFKASGLQLPGRLRQQSVQRNGNVRDC